MGQGKQGEKNPRGGGKPGVNKGNRESDDDERTRTQKKGPEREGFKCQIEEKKRRKEFGGGGGTKELKTRKCRSLWRNISNLFFGIQT